MAKYTQETRLLDLQTPLGKDALLIRSIQGEEAISQLYNYVIECFGDSETPVNFNDLIGQPVHVAVNMGPDRQKYFHGLVRMLTRHTLPLPNELPVGDRPQILAADPAHAKPHFPAQI